jgi:hypothetical protein
VNVLQTAQDLVDEGLEMGIRQRLTRADNSRQIALHQLCRIISVVSRSMARNGRTLVKIALIEVVGAGNVHVIEAGNLYTGVQRQALAVGVGMRSARRVVLRSCVLRGVSMWYCRRVRWPADVPLKCCSSLISRSARLARIFLLKTLVTFLIATPSPVWLLVAALGAYNQHVHVHALGRGSSPTRQCRMRLVPAPWLHCSARRR